MNKTFVPCHAYSTLKTSTSIPSIRARKGIRKPILQVAPKMAFQLNSHQTAVAFVIPEHLGAEIDSLREVHDRAFHKWRPHINLIYPFVRRSDLEPAVALLREALKSEPVIQLNTENVGFFSQGKYGTVFLKPSSLIEDQICSLRKSLIASLSCNPATGTKDGVFYPHLTIGRAGPGHPSIETLLAKARGLEKIAWEATTIAILNRQNSGQMEVVGQLAIG